MGDRYVNIPFEKNMSESSRQKTIARVQSVLDRLGHDVANTLTSPTTGMGQHRRRSSYGHPMIRVEGGQQLIQE